MILKSLLLPIHKFGAQGRQLTINAGDCGSESPLSMFCGNLKLFTFIKSCVKVPQRLIATLGCTKYLGNLKMKTIDLNRFPLQFAQTGVNFCIPAAAWSIFKYHDQSFPDSQEYLLSLMVVNSSDHQPSFGAMVSHVLPVYRNRFDIRNPSPQSFQAWSDNIKKEIDSFNPIAIATRVSSNNVHIRVAIGYDDGKQEFLLFNPGISLLSPVMVNNQTQPGLIIQIQSVLEPYSYNDAAAHYHAPKASNDQLVIHRV